MKIYGFPPHFAVLGLIIPEKDHVTAVLGVFIVLINYTSVSSSSRGSVLNFENCDPNAEFLLIVPLNTVYDMRALKRVGGRALHVCTHTIKLIILLEKLMVNIMLQSQFTAVTMDQA
jgi:hypothetical protein